MNHLPCFFACFIIPSFLIGLSSCNGETDQPAGERNGEEPPTYAQSTQNTRANAAEGDSVWVIVNHVKPDKREQFEQFVHEVFWPSAQQLSPEEQRAFSSTRILHPVGPEADGTYSYIFFIDPIIQGFNYGIIDNLEKMYPKEKAAEYDRMFSETMAREQTQYRVVQGRSYQYD